MLLSDTKNSGTPNFFSPITKRSLRLLQRNLLIVFFIWLIGGWPAIVFALPQDGQIVSGSGAITEPTDTSMQVDQNTSEMIVNWNSFNIGQSESVNFTQPSINAIALNRVIGSDPSLILGSLTANGQVFVSNGSGVFFGAGSQVDTHGLIATTMAISDQDFLDKNYNFVQDVDNPLTAVINEGNISATRYVGLLAPAVENRGTLITASLGSVDIAAGKAATLDFTGDGLISFEVTEAVSGTVKDKDGNVLQDRVSNTGLIQANGGQVRMTAKDAGDVIRHVVNMEGVIEAKTVAEEDGWVILGGGDSGVVNVSGTIDASGDDVGEKGGTVRVTGEKVGLFDNAVVNVSGDSGGGEALIGGDYKGGNSEVQNATNTYMAEGASIYVDALTDGDGGKVILWSEETSRIYGNISARGGSISGDGGFVETSSKEYIELTSIVDVGSVSGQGGHWLIDPTDINITNTDLNTTNNSNVFESTTAATASSTIDVATLVAALNGTSGITITIDTASGTDSGEAGTVQLSANFATNTIGSGATLIIDADSTVTLSAAITDTGAGLNVTITTPGIVALQGNITTNGGNFTQTAGASSVTLQGITIDTGGGDINFNNAITLTGGSGLDTGAGSGDINIASTVDGTHSLTVDSGTGSTTFSGNVGGSSALGGLTITNSGSTTFSGTVSSGTLDVTSTGNITGTAGAFTITGITSLDSSGGVGTITLTNTSNVFTGAITFSVGTGAVSLTDTTAISLGATTFGGALTLNSNAGITFTGNITTAGTTTIDADLDNNGVGDFTVNSGISLNTTNSTLAITTKDLILNGTINTGTGEISLETSTSASVGIGGPSGSVASTVLTICGTCSLSIAGSELTNMTAATLTVGGVNSGITVSEVTVANTANITSFVMNASAASSAIAFSSLGNIFANSLTARASNGLTVSGDLTSQSGGVTLDADFDDSGAGNFVVADSTTVNTTNQSLSITGNDFNLNTSGALNAGTGAVTIIVSDSGSIGLGDTGSAMSISGAELQNITASTLTMGDGLGGGIGVDNITAANSNNVGTVTLNATNTGSGVSFSNTASTFNTLNVNGGSGITFNVGVTTDTGALTLDGDQDGDGTGDVNLNSSAALISNNNNISIKANDIGGSGGTINAGTGDVTITSSDNEDINVGITTGSGMFVTGAELQNITAANLTFSTALGIDVKGITAANSDNISGTTTFISTGGTVTFSNTDSTFNTIAANATGNIGISVNVTTDAGGMTFNADSDDNGAGSFQVSDGNTVSTTNNALTITADDLDLNTSGALNSGTATTTILVSDGGDIGLGATAGGMTISGAELQNITAANLIIGDSTTGNITVDNISATNSNGISGTVTLNATADNARIQFSGSASTFNTLTANADDGIDIDIGLSTDVGNMVLEGDADNAIDANDHIAIATGLTVSSAGSLTLDATTGGLTTNGSVTLNAENGVTINDSFTSTGAGTITVDADTDNNGTGDFTLASGAAINFSTNNNNLTINAADVTINGTINSGSGVLDLFASTAGVGYGLGGGAGAFTVTQAELDNITTSAQMRIGASTGQVNTITVGTIDFASKAVLFRGASSFIVNTSYSSTNAAFNAIVTDVVLNGTINTGSGDLRFQVSGSGTIGLDGNAATAATVSSICGGSCGMTISGAELQNIITTGTLNLGGTSLTGNHFVDSISAAQSNNVGLVLMDNRVSTGSVTFTGGASTFNALQVRADDGATFNVDVTTDVGTLTIDGDFDNTAATNDNIVIASGVTLTSAGNITMDATTGGITGSGALTLNADNGITINNTLTASGNLTMDGDADNASDGTDSISIAAGLTISSTGTVTLDATTGGISGSGAATVNADDGLVINDNFTAAGNLTLDGDADNATDTNDKLTLATGITLTSTSTGVLTLNATTGGIEAAGALTLNSNDGMSIVDNLTSIGTGTITIDTDVNNDGIGGFDLAAGKTITTNNNDLSITNENFQLNSTGIINAGTGDMTLAISVTGNVGLGDATCGGTCDMGISGAELQNITANNLTISSAASAGSIIVDNITAANSNNITTVVLDANQDNSPITFSGTASIFNALTANADDGISFLVNLTTDTGNLILDGDSDNASDAGDNISIQAGLTITSAGSLTLDATTSGITTQGATTFNAANGITINNSFTSTGAGTVTIDADTDNNGTGDFALASGAAINFSTNNNNLVVTANDADIQGTINNGSGSLTITPSDGGTLGIGSTTCNGTCGMTLSGSELQALTNSGSVTLGDIGTTTTGSITIGDLTTANNAGFTGNFSIEALADNASITFTGTSINIAASFYDADDGIKLNNDVNFLFGFIPDGDFDNAVDSNDAITFAAGITVTAQAGRITMDATSGGFIALGALTLSASNRVDFNDSFTSTGTGAILITGDSGSVGAGNFNVAVGKTVTTNNNNLSITTDDIDLSGSIAAGTGTVTIVVSDAEPIMLDGTLSTGSAVSSSGLCSATCGLTINGLEIQNITAGNLIIGDNTHARLAVDSITAGHTGNITGTITLNTTSNGSSGIIFGTTASTFAGALTANAGNGVQLAVGLTINGLGTFNTDTDNNGTGAFTIVNSSTLTSNNNNVDVTGAGFALGGSGDFLNAGTADVTLATTNGRSIGLGATSTDTQITGTNLQNITAANLTIGDSTIGNITVDGISLANSANISTTLTLITGGNVVFSTGASAITNNFAVTATGDITQSVSLDVGGTSSFTVTGTNVATLTNASNDFTGAVTLSSGTGAVQLTNSTATILAASTLGGDLTVTSSGAMTQTGALSVTGTSDFTVSGSNAMTLTNTSNDFTGAVTLASGTGAVQLTDSTSTILAASTMGGAFTVTSGGDITQTGALAVTGTSSLTVDGSSVATLTNSSNDFTGALTLSSGTGLVQVTDTNSMTLAASTLGGALTLSAVSGLFVTGDYTGSGALTLNSDSNTDGTGDLDVSANVAVNTNNNSIEITQADTSFSSGVTVNAGTAGVTSNFTKAVTVDGTDASGVTAGSLTTTSTGNITVDGVTSAELANISGTYSLTSSGDIIFQTTATTTNDALTVKANNDIKVQVDVTSDGNFTAVADNDSNGAGSFILDTDVTVKSSSGNIDLTAAQIDDNGTLTTSSTGTITKNGVLTKLTGSDQSDLDSGTNSSFVQDFTSPSTESGC